MKAHDEAVAASGKDLVQVVPVNTVHGTTPASLGLVFSYAMSVDDGRLTEKYDFVPMFLSDVDRIAERAKRPGVFLFSNYLWNVDANMMLSAAVKQANPLNVTVHGGPSTPSYEQECEDFFRDFPHVDVAVRAEGEATLVDVLDKLNLAETGSLDSLKDVPGISYRSDNGVVRLGARDRIPDLNVIPSPYLNGLFDEFGAVRASAVIESNRGCPYGCTFCDWGSATLSKVRKFDLERVFAELEWSARHRVEDASIADANFGMLRRDVDIAQCVADLRKEHGYPNTVGISYAKNQVRYLRDIIRIMAEAGILTEGKVSLQTMDANTLKVIDRENMKLSKFNELGMEFRKANLPLGVELMMGLPGSSAQSFRNDLQDCTNRDVRVQVNPTMILPNSPMNAPEYRKEHKIIATTGEYIKETATYDRNDWDNMMQLRSAYTLLDTYGLVRYVARFVRAEIGMAELEFYDQLQNDVLSNSARWPVLAGALRTMKDCMAPPGSWSFYVDEVKDYVVSKIGLPDDSCLRTVLAVQLAHLPAADRVFPHKLELEHDFTAWWRAMLDAREDGHREDWEKHVPRLREYGPAELTITDPNKICVLEVGKALSALDYNLRTWELDSPVARARTLMAARAG
ncbi:MAG: B12-binding domain-containing radical SAM protein [Halioglobus sp.]|nr:B12-binding domain-containing radical SAM protein [Halioglobus sp.]